MASACAGSSTQTRLERRPGSGTSVNGPLGVWNSVEVSRCGRECLKQTVSATCGYSRSSTAMPAASRQSERRPSAPITSGALNVSPLLSVTRDRVVARLDAAHLVLDHAQAGERAGALLERRDQMTVLDIVAEGVEIDFVGREFHLRRAPQPPGVVDDAHHLASAPPALRTIPRRRGSSSAVTEPASRAVVRLSGRAGRFPTSTVAMPRAGERDRRGQAGRPAAHHDGRRLAATAIFVRHQSARSCCALTISMRRAMRKPCQGFRYPGPARCAMHGDVRMSEAADHDLTHLPPAASRLGAAFARPKVLAVDLRGRAGGPRLALRSALHALAGMGGSLLPRACVSPTRPCRQPARWGAGGFAHRGADVGRHDARHDAAERGAHDPHLRRDRRHRRAQGRAHRLAVRAGRRLHAWCGSALPPPRRWRNSPSPAPRCSTPAWPRRAGCSRARSSSAPASTSSPRSSTPASGNASSPFPFFFANWATTPRGVFRLGVRQGLYCLGCCWAMMLVMFAVGVMNVIWMAALGMVMTIEKIGTGKRFTLRCRRCADRRRRCLRAVGALRPIGRCARFELENQKDRE